MWQGNESILGWLLGTLTVIEGNDCICFECLQSRKVSVSVESRVDEVVESKKNEMPRCRGSPFESTTVVASGWRQHAVTVACSEIE